MKKYITVFPFIHINIKDNNTLFYNTLSRSNAVFTNNDAIAQIAKKLEESNLTCMVEEEQINVLKQNNFFKILLLNNFGYYVDAEKLPVPPFTTRCIDVNDTRLVTNFKNHEYLLENVRELTFYLNNFASAKNQTKVRKAHYQFLFPVYDEEKKELNLKEIISIIKVIGNHQININITGGNILEYSNFYELINELNNCRHNVFYYFHYLDLVNSDNNKLLSAISQKTIKVILVDFPFELKEFVKWNEIIKQDGVRIEFIVENEEQITEAEQIISEFAINDHMFRPYYNGENIKFFKENVFVSERDIIEVKESLFDLATKKISNPSFFGKLIFNTDGNIFTSFNFPAIGNINNLNLKNLIFELLEDENSIWRVNKTIVEPCNNCIYNLLCPPISNYEYLINKHNLCNVK